MSQICSLNIPEMRTPLYTGHFTKVSTIEGFHCMSKFFITASRDPYSFLQKAVRDSTLASTYFRVKVVKLGLGLGIGWGLGAN